MMVENSEKGQFNGRAPTAHADGQTETSMGLMENKQYEKELDYEIKK
jgi:hypothetical protein